MADVIFKCTIDFDIRAHGWSESYWCTQPTAEYQAAMDQLESLAIDRAKLLGQEANVKALRVSIEGINQDAFLEYRILTGNTQEPCADQDLGVLFTMRDDTNSRFKNTWLKGFWDSVESNAGVYLPNTPGWKAKMNAWKVNFGDKNARWGWWGVDKTTKVTFDLLGYTQDANNLVQFVFAGPLFNGIPAGTKVQINLVGVNGKSKINGKQVVIVDTNASAHTFLPLAVVPFAFGGKGTGWRNRFFLARGCQDKKISERKTGAPLLEGHGRRKGRGRV